MEIGNKINQLRKLSGMTQEQLAEKLNVSRPVSYTHLRAHET